MVDNTFAVIEVLRDRPSRDEFMVGAIEVNAGVLGNPDTAPHPGIDLDKFEITIVLIPDELGMSQPGVLKSSESLAGFFQQLIGPFGYALDGHAAVARIGEELSMGAQSKRASLVEETTH